jgi:hypothetical protein
MFIATMGPCSPSWSRELVAKSTTTEAVRDMALRLNAAAGLEENDV